MLMAARKLQGIGLVLLVLLIAMALYPVSLKVAATRSELATVEREIARSRSNIRYLESELAVRASMRQLEHWNADTFGYSAPTAAQYLAGERALASLDGLNRNFKSQPVAPVLMAMAPAGGASADSATPVATDRVAPAQTMLARAALASAAKAATRHDAGVSGQGAKPATRPAPEAVTASARRGARLAMIEDQLLSDDTLRDIRDQAAREAKGAARP